MIGPNFKPFYDKDKGKDLGVSSWPPEGWKIGGGTMWGWIFWYVRKLPVKSFSDASDNSFYWYFTVGIWVPVYLLVYVGPRIF